MTNAFDTFVAEIRNLIAPVLKSGLDADHYARGIADEIDFFEDEAHFEVRGFHTNTGNPMTFDIDIPAALKQQITDDE